MLGESGGHVGFGMLDRHLSSLAQALSYSNAVLVFQKAVFGACYDPTSPDPSMLA